MLRESVTDTHVVIGRQQSAPRLHRMAVNFAFENPLLERFDLRVNNSIDLRVLKQIKKYRES